MKMQEIIPRARQFNKAAARPQLARLEILEDRLLFSGHAVNTAFTGGNLTITVSEADHVTITEAVAKGANDVTGPYTFTVTDSKHSIGGSGPGAFSDVKNIAVSVGASGSIVSVQGIVDNGQNQATGIPGNLTISDTQPNNKLSVEVHDGFTAGGAVSITNTGKGSTFVPQTLKDGQVETGVFLDSNRKGSYGSVYVQGSGSVGIDGVKVVGSVNVYLGSSASVFYAGAEWVYRQDPDAPPWSTFRQDPSVIGGNLSIVGGGAVEVYNTVVSRYVTIDEASAPSVNEYALLGGDTVGAGLYISESGETNAAYIDFSSVAGNTTILQGNGANVIGIDTSLTGGATTLTQGMGADFIFIDSQALLDKASVGFQGGLQTDAKYISELSSVGLVPFEAGSTFVGSVASTQGAGAHQLEIAQDPTPLTIFATAKSEFSAEAGYTIDVSVKALGLPITISGYGPYHITGF